MGNDLPPCPEDALGEFVKGVKAQLWRSNVLMVGNVVLVTSMVVVSATGWRYRHSAVTRFISLVATTLFLPITSYVVSSIGSENCKAAGLKMDCIEQRYIFLLLMWTVLVQTIGINFSVIVAVDDGDGQKLGPSIELLARALWTSYLVFYYYDTAILAEAWEVASYICSNWLKVTLICSYVTHASWQQSPMVHKWLGLALKFRIRWVKSCSDKMGQISLLPHRQPKASGLRQKLFHFSDHGVQHVKVPSEVKAAIVESLISSNGSLSQGVVALQNTRIGNNVVWAIQGESTTDVILVWHIATGIVEARHAASTSPSADRSVATYISQYCVYLLKAAPELLPDDKTWSKKRYKAVSEEISQLLRDLNRKSSMDYDKMIELLSKSSNQHDQVVNNGVRLGKQLVEQQDVEAEAVWGVLAKFWSEMILYVAPSDNLKAHKESIARGGELLTLVWVLLTNAGIITRPGIRTAA